MLKCGVRFPSVTAEVIACDVDARCITHFYEYQKEARGTGLLPMCQYHSEQTGYEGGPFRVLKEMKCHYMFVSDEDANNPDPNFFPKMADCGLEATHILMTLEAGDNYFVLACPFHSDPEMWLDEMVEVEKLP